MESFYLWRWGGIIAILTGLLLVIGAILVLVVPDGGLGNDAAPTLYYIALVLMVFALLAIYGVQGRSARSWGLAGFLLALLGAVLYSAPLYALIVGAPGTEAWDSIWGLNTDDLLTLGGAIFPIGLALLGLETMRLGILPRWSGIPLLVGGLVWFLAYWGLSFLLAPATLITALGLLWVGYSLFAGRYLGTQPPEPVEP